MKARDVTNGSKINAFGVKGTASSVSRDKQHTYVTVKGSIIRFRNSTKVK